MPVISNGLIQDGPYQQNTDSSTGVTIGLTPRITFTNVTDIGNNKCEITFQWSIYGGNLTLETRAESFTLYPGGGLSPDISVMTGTNNPIYIATSKFQATQGADLSSQNFNLQWTGGGSTAGEDQAWGSYFATPNGFTIPGLQAPTFYKAPSGFSVSVVSMTDTSITVSAKWTNGTKTSSATISAGGKSATISSSNGTATLTGLTANTSYTINGSLSDGQTTLSASATTKTWFAPIANLQVNLSNRWYWYLEVNANFDYLGTIQKYEFDIGGEGYKDKGTTNKHSRGATTPNGTGKLTYNTDYVCKARLTDNYGRVKEATATFKTLDERPLYLDGQLREVKVIKPDGTVITITPDLLTVIKQDNTTVNMNKIINNDSRSQFS